jgi:TolB-like protein
MTHTASNTARLCANDDGSFDTCIDMSPEKESTSVEHKKNNNLHFNMLGEYTEQMAVELERDVYSLQIDEAIAVASFVHLDTSLRNTNALGIQLAESFINELQQIGLPVIDHKLMGVLDINDKGDFAFSRNMSDLYNEINIGYVLTGTMLRNSRGILVNARLIDYKTNVVIASSSKLLPTLLVADLL